MSTSYCYLIGWSAQNKWYYGRRTGKDCHPSEFWVKYFTSSKKVKEFRKVFGEPDIIQIRKTFINPALCASWEARVLTRINAAKSSNWLNKTNGDAKWDTTGIRNSPEKIANMIAGIKKWKELNPADFKLKQARACAAAREVVLGVTKSPVHKAAISAALAGRIMTAEHKESLSYKAKNRPKITCIHCGKITASSQHHSHLAKCKSKPMAE